MPPARRLRLSAAFRACLAAAAGAAHARGAVVLSQSHCVLVLLEQQPPPELYIPLREAFVRAQDLRRELGIRLPPVNAVSITRAPLPADDGLARLIDQYGFLDDNEALLNIFLFNPDAILADAIAHA